MAKSIGCSRKREKPAGDCKIGVVYEMPLACGHVYIGQTGRYFNDRVTEHSKNENNKDGSSLLSCHVEECGNCFPVWDQCAVQRP